MTSWEPPKAPLLLSIWRRKEPPATLVRGLIRDGLVSAVHDCSDGGLYVAVAEMALAGNIGAHISTSGINLPAHATLFGEDQGRYVIAIDPANTEAIVGRASQSNLDIRALGETGGGDLTVDGAEPISLSTLRAIHEGWLPNYMDTVKT